jgi:hypothetical protein
METGMDEAVKLANWVAANYGLLPAYAIIISAGALMAHSLKHLSFMLGIMGGVYVVMFQTFNLQAKLLPFDLAHALAGYQLPAGISLDLLNKVVAFVFVYLIGYTVYGLKRAAVPAEA